MPIWTATNIYQSVEGMHIVHALCLLQLLLVIMHLQDSKPDKPEGDHAYSRKHRLHLQKGRKVGCPATGIVKELLKYVVHSSPFLCRKCMLAL